MGEAVVNIEFFDTTMRDGDQALPEENQFDVGDKEDIARTIAGFGVNVIEAGFPRTPGDAEEVRQVASTVGNQSFAVMDWQSEALSGTWEANEFTGVTTRTPVIAGLSRTTVQDIDATWDAIQGAERPRIHTFISTDAYHMAKRFPGKTPDEVLRMGRDAIRMARQYTDAHSGGSLEFSAEAASTTDDEFSEIVVRMAVSEGIDILNMPDTVGQKRPLWMYKFYSRVLDWALAENENIVVSAHNHNDLGNASANSFAFVEAAADVAERRGKPVNIQIEGTFCGIGERAGNADLFTVMGNVFKYAGELAVPLRWQNNPETSVKSARTVMEFAGLDVDRQNPVVGSDIIVQRAGVHSDGVAKGDFWMYSPFDPRFWGHEFSVVHEDGKYQGAAGRAAIAASQNDRVASYSGASDVRAALAGHSDAGSIASDYKGFEKELAEAGVTV